MAARPAQLIRILATPAGRINNGVIYHYLQLGLDEQQSGNVRISSEP
jgi:hypothetical protein